MHIHDSLNLTPNTVRYLSLFSLIRDIENICSAAGCSNPAIRVYMENNRLVETVFTEYPAATGAMDKILSYTCATEPIIPLSDSGSNISADISAVFRNM